MPLIHTFRETRREKPEEDVKLDLLHPYPASLAGGWMFNEGAGLHVHDLTENNDGDITGNTVSWARSRFGRALSFTGDGNTHRIDLGSIVSANPFSLFGATNALFICRVFIDEPAGTSDPVILGKANGALAANGWGISYNSASNSWFFAVNGSFVNSAGQADGDRWATMAIFATAGSTLFYEGDAVAIGTAGGLLGGVPATTTPGVIGNQATLADGQWRGLLEHAFVFKDIDFDHVEAIHELFHNPYQLLEPIIRPVYFPSAEGVTLVIADALHGHAADSPALVQQHLLAIDDALQGHTAGTPTLIQQHTLAIAEALHGHTADNVVLVQQHILAIADALHGHAAESPTLIQQHTLAIAEALHGHTADNVTLSTATLLVIAEALHGHAAESPTLIQQHTLAIAEALHGHTADNVTLDTATVLAIADALHGHAADSPSLIQQHLLGINDALQGLTADNVDLIQQNTLGVDDALHGHAAESPALSVSTLLAIADALHTQAADNITLDTATTLAISDAVHAHLAESPALIQDHILVINDALHAHLADQCNVFEGILTIDTPSGRVFVIESSDNVYAILETDKNRVYPVDE